MFFDEIEQTSLLDACLQRVAHEVVDVVDAAEHTQRLMIGLLFLLHPRIELAQRIRVLAQDAGQTVAGAVVCALGLPFCVIARIRRFPAVKPRPVPVSVRVIADDRPRQQCPHVIECLRRVHPPRQRPAPAQEVIELVRAAAAIDGFPVIGVAMQIALEIEAPEIAPHAAPHPAVLESLPLASHLRRPRGKDAADHVAQLGWMDGFGHDFSGLLGC